MAKTRIRYNIAYVPSVFEYKTERGVVYVYVLESSPADIFGVVTFRDYEGEGAQEAYAVASLLWTSTTILIRQAESRYADNRGEDVDNVNPFTKLLSDKTAMKRLDKLLQEAGND